MIKSLLDDQCLISLLSTVKFPLTDFSIEFYIPSDLGGKVNDFLLSSKHLSKGGLKDAENDYKSIYYQKPRDHRCAAKLIALNPTDKYSKQKAAGSLGGASRWGFIVLNNGIWERMR